MTAYVARQAYGKSKVRVSSIRRESERHEFTEVEVSILLEGDFDAAYGEADNRLVVPTDTVKNTVYVLAKRHGLAPIERFALAAGEHFLEKYSHVDRVAVAVDERPWQRVPGATGDEGHPHAFVGVDGETRTCRVVKRRDGVEMECGLAGVKVLKTTRSGFSDFHRDEFTTLAATDDRIFATTVAASWPCGDVDADWTTIRETVRRSILEVFSGRFSPSVQATMFEMAEAVFAACGGIDEISFTMPNQHHLLLDLSAFDLANENEIFVPTDEPHGDIRATLRRGERP